MELIETVVWDGGTESHMFNRLEAIAQEECPRTPILHCSISRSLIPAVVQNNVCNTKIKNSELCTWSLWQLLKYVPLNPVHD